MLITILEALIALPKIGSMVQDAVSAIVGWWVSRQETETLGMIADAAAMAAMAKTDEDRFLAAEAWQRALKRSRYTE